MVAELPPLSVFAANDQAIHERHVLVFLNPRKLIGIGIGHERVAPVCDNRWCLGLEVFVLEDHCFAKTRYVGRKNYSE